jgi:hypothetical protein
VRSGDLAEQLGERKVLTAVAFFETADARAALSEIDLLMEQQGHKLEYVQRRQMVAWVQDVERGYHHRNRRIIEDFERELVTAIGARIDQGRAAVPLTVKETTSDGILKMLLDRTVNGDAFEARINGVVERNIIPFMLQAQDGGMAAVQRLQNRLKDNHARFLVNLAAGHSNHQQDIVLRNILAENVQHINTVGIISDPVTMLRLSLIIGGLEPLIFWKSNWRVLRGSYMLLRGIALAGARKLARRGAFAVGLSFCDGPLPIFDTLGFLATAYTAYEIAKQVRSIQRELPKQVEKNLNQTLTAYESHLYRHLHAVTVASLMKAEQHEQLVSKMRRESLGQE